MWIYIETDTLIININIIDSYSYVWVCAQTGKLEMKRFSIIQTHTHRFTCPYVHM